MRKHEEKTTRKRLHVFLDDDLMNRVVERAKRERRTKTEVVRQALIMYTLQIDRAESN